MKNETEMPDFSFQEFCAETANFRQIWGTKDFWQKAGRIRDKAFSGYTLVYFNCKTTSEEEKEKLINIFKSTTDEYTRRESMLMQMGKVNLFY